MSLYCIECRNAHFLEHPKPVFLVIQGDATKFLPVCGAVCERVPGEARCEPFTLAEHDGLTICRAKVRRGWGKSYATTSLRIGKFWFSLSTDDARLYLPVALKRLSLIPT